MFKISGVLMPKRGRPKKGTPPKVPGATQPLVRIDPELVDKLNWIVEMKVMNGQKGYTAAMFVEPLIRDPIQNDYRVIEEDVENIKRIKAKAALKMKQHDAGSEQE